MYMMKKRYQKPHTEAQKQQRNKLQQDRRQSRDFLQLRQDLDNWNAARRLRASQLNSSSQDAQGTSSSSTVLMDVVPDTTYQRPQRNNRRPPQNRTPQSPPKAKKQKSTANRPIAPPHNNEKLMQYLQLEILYLVGI